MFNLFGPKIPQIDATEVKNAIDAKKKFILLDVRTTNEYAGGKIAGSINVPLDQIPGKITKTIPDKDATIYIYCLSGARSASAAQIMEKLGYTNIYNMTSGLLAWRANRFPLVP